MRKLVLCLLALLPALSGAQEPVQPLVFGINEGVTYRISASEVRERYREIADDLTKILKRPVRIEYMDEYVQMGKDLEVARYDARRTARRPDSACTAGAANSRRRRER